MQQSLLLAIRENDSEPLANLLTTATEVEKANAALLAAFTNKLGRLKQLIASGADINRVDKDGNTCLHWAVENNNLSMLKLLLANGAGHKTNKNGDTPAHLAEEKGYFKLFNALVQHYVIEPFTIDIQDKVIEGELILQGEPVPEISARTLQLLMHYHIKKSDMDAANDRLQEIDKNFVGIELREMEGVMCPSFFRKFFRFLTSVSMVRMLLLWPLMNRNRIKLYEDILEDDEIATIDRLSNQTNDDLLGSESESNRQDLLAISDEEPALSSDADFDRQPLIKSSANEQKVLKDFSKIPPQKGSKISQGCKKIRQTSGCSFPILTTYALPFECETTQKIVFFLSTWHITAEESFDGIWSLLWLSLLAQGVFNFYQYPRERSEYQTIFDVLGLNSPFNEYQRLLSRALVSPMLAFVLGIPALLGFLNAIRAARNNQTVGNTEVNALVRQLKRYQPGLLADGFGWVLTAVLPDAFAPLALCYLLPQPAIKQALEQIQQCILWDGRLPAKERLKLFNALYQFAHHRTQFTQMKALSMLAALANGIDVRTLSLLQGEGVSEANTKAFLFIKIQSLQALDFLANHYYLPGVPKSLFRPLFRYIYANYLMWQIGYPQQWLVQPLFYLYRTVKFYFVFQFYLALVTGLDWYYHRSNENMDGICRLLPDFADMPRHYKPTRCFEEYLKTPKKFEELMRVIEMLPEFERYISDIRIDLSAQMKLIQMKKLPSILSGLAKVITNNRFSIYGLILQNIQLSLEDMNTMGDFLAEIEKEDITIDLSQSIIEVGGIAAFIQAVTVANKQSLLGNRLILSDVPMHDIDVTMLATIVPILNEIHLNNCNISAKSCLLLAEKIAQRKNDQLEKVNLADNLIHSDCAEIIAASLPLRYLNLGGNNVIGDQGIEAFARNLNKHRPTRFLRLLRVSPEASWPIEIAQDELIARVDSYNNLIIYYSNARGRTISSSSYAYNNPLIVSRLPAIGQQTQDSELIKLINEICCAFHNLEYILSGYNVSDHSLLQLINALPEKRLYKFHYIDRQANDQRNFSFIIPRLTQVLNQSRIEYFGWSSLGGMGLGDEGAKLLGDALIKNPTSVWSWDLSDNQIGSEGIQRLVKSLVFNKVFNDKYSLILRNNQIGSGIASIAEAITAQMKKSSPIYLNLDLANNHITENDILKFTALVQSVDPAFVNLIIDKLSLSNNIIGDQGIIEMMGLNFYSRVALLNFSRTNMSRIGTEAIIKTLESPRHLLWIETLITTWLSWLRAYYNERNREITILDLSNNFIDNESALALCDAFARSKRASDNRINRDSDEKIILTGNPINQTIIENCGHLVSESHSLCVYSPYVFLYRFYRGFYDVVSQSLFNADKTLVVQSQNETTTEIALVESDYGINDFDTIDETAMVCIEAEEASTSLLYTSLLTICETFLQAVHQSAWLTAIPIFAEEILYRTGGYTREEMARFHQELQTLLMVSFAHSPHSLVASYLARWLTHQLTDSPQVIATVGTGAALATAVFENALNTSASFRWIALQAGVALMGSVLGSLSVQQIPKVGQWGVNQFNCAKNYIGSRVSFWSSPAEVEETVVTPESTHTLPTANSLNPVMHFKMH